MSQTTISIDTIPPSTSPKLPTTELEFRQTDVEPCSTTSLTESEQWDFFRSKRYTKETSSLARQYVHTVKEKSAGEGAEDDDEESSGPGSPASTWPAVECKDFAGSTNWIGHCKGASESFLAISNQWRKERYSRALDLSKAIKARKSDADFDDGSSKHPKPTSPTRASLWRSSISSGLAIQSRSRHLIKVEVASLCSQLAVD